MDKNYRLFLRNLPPDINDEELEKLFNEHGTVTNIDIKEKIQNDGSRIAFVNLGTTDKRLNTCFRAVNGAVLRDYTIHVEVAKESFLDRLKREREEASNRTVPVKETIIAHDQPIEKINIKLPKTIKNKPTKRIYNFDDAENDDSTEHCAEQSNKISDFSYDPALQVETVPVKKERIIKIESQITHKPDVRIEKIPEKKILSESEIKRLASVKQKRQSFRAKEQLISHALKAVDSTNKNKKIVFSDDIDEIDYGKKRSKSLFDDVEDDEEQGEWNENKFEHDEKRNAKLTMSLKNLGRDKRFNIDERFLDDAEDSSEVKVAEENTENDLKNETKWQLDILQNVLGKPFKARDEKFIAKKQNKMVRYDPTASGHRDHELEMTAKTAIKVKKAKAAKNEIEPEEAPILVSSDVFYTVSDNLTESLKPQEEFSLLKSFGTATATDKNRSDEYDATADAAQKQKYERDYSAKNPFKYESSDEEGADPTMDQLTRNNENSAKHKLNSQTNERNDTFFFAIDDQRFHDAEDFFKTKPSTTENFTNVRRELKQIVRSKIRNNVKKNTPWRNTKIGKQAKIR